MTVDATHRTTLLHVPPGLAAGQPTALVIALHGVGGSGPKMEPYSGFSTVADRHRFVVAYPSSAGSYWNSTADRRLPDDVRFLGRLITTIEAQECIDPGRTYLAGVSNGGGMAALAACQLATQVSAFASVAGGYDGQPPCRPRRPVSVLEVHGTADQIVPYFGRTRRPTRDRLPPFVNAWVSRDRCRREPDGHASRPRVRPRSGGRAARVGCGWRTSASSMVAINGLARRRRIPARRRRSARPARSGASSPVSARGGVGGEHRVASAWCSGS